MRAALLFLLVLTGSALAQSSDSGIWFPTTTLMTAGVGEASWPASDVMVCSDFIPAVGISNATSMSFGINNVATTCGLVLYDSTGTTVIRAATGDCPTSGAGARATFSSLTAFSLSAGTAYRVCWCIKNATGFYSVNLGSGTISELLNTYATHVGTAANACTNGVTPATSGALTPSATLSPLSIWISKE